MTDKNIEIKMSQSQYEKIGNLEDYKHEPRVSAPAGLVSEPSLVLKFYTMFKEKNGHLADGVLNESKKFLKKEIRNRKIKPLSGLGFVILSEDMLNVARWDDDYPIVLKNLIYGYENNNINNSKLLDINKVGSFCIWELGIVNYERNSWKRYLESEKEKENKIKYLEEVFFGRIK